MLIVGKMSEISKIPTDNKIDIDTMLDFLIKAKLEGATHIKTTWSGDPMWRYSHIVAVK